jgi:hypothetical protein
MGVKISKESPFVRASLVVDAESNVQWHTFFLQITLASTWHNSVILKREAVHFFDVGTFNFYDVQKSTRRPSFSSITAMKTWELEYNYLKIWAIICLINSIHGSIILFKTSVSHSGQPVSQIYMPAHYVLYLRNWL